MAKKINFKDMPIKVIGITGGVGATMLVASKFPNVNPLYVGGTAIVAGALIPSFMPKMPIAESIGDGLIAGGAAVMLKKMVPSIAGIEEDNATVNADPSHEQITNEYLMSGLGALEDYQTVSGDGNETTENVGKTDEEETVS